MISYNNILDEEYRMLKYEIEEVLALEIATIKKEAEFQEVIVPIRKLQEEESHSTYLAWHVNRKMFTLYIITNVPEIKSFVQQHTDIYMEGTPGIHVHQIKKESREAIGLTY